MEEMVKVRVSVRTNSVPVGPPDIVKDAVRGIVSQAVLEKLSSCVWVRVPTGVTVRLVRLGAKVSVLVRKKFCDGRVIVVVVRLTLVKVDVVVVKKVIPIRMELVRMVTVLLSTVLVRVRITWEVLVERRMAVLRVVLKLVYTKVVEVTVEVKVKSEKLKRVREVVAVWFSRIVVLIVRTETERTELVMVVVLVRMLVEVVVNWETTVVVVNSVVQVVS